MQLAAAEVVVEVMLQVVYYELELAVYLYECYVRRPWVYVGEVGFCTLVIGLPLLLCSWSPSG